VQNLKDGTILRFKTESATVRANRRQNYSLQNLVKIHFKKTSNFLTLISDHALWIRSETSERPHVELAYAANVQRGAFVRTTTGYAEVERVDEFAMEVGVHEITFALPDECAFASIGPSSQEAVQVFGNVAATFRPCVKLLRFKGSWGFSKLFFDPELRAPELAPCRESLSNVGLSMNLYDMDLGPGILVITNGDLAKQVVEYLRGSRVERDGKWVVDIRGKHFSGDPSEQTKLRESSCIVTTDMEEIVRRLVLDNPYGQGHTNRVINESGYVLDLDINKYLDINSDRKRPWSLLAPNRHEAFQGGKIAKGPLRRHESDVSKSTTDARDRYTSATNPRLYACGREGS